MLSLAECMPGAALRLLGFAQGVPASYRRRLLALGLTPGTQFVLRRVAPFGDPVEITLRGFALSLRKHEAAGLLLERVS